MQEGEHDTMDYGSMMASTIAKKQGVQFDADADKQPCMMRYTPLTRTDFDMNVIDKWIEIKAQNTPKRRCDHISFVYKDQLYVIGGRDINEGKIEDSYVIDLKTILLEPKWEKVYFNIGKPPEALANHAGDLVENQYYLFGGENIYNQPTNNLYIFDIEGGDKWERKQFNETDIPAMIGHSVNYYAPAKLLIVFGGFHKGIYSNAIYTYDNTKWTRIQYRDNEKVLKGRIFHTATLVGDSLYIYGGETLDGGLLSDIWRYDLKKSTWEEITVKGEVPKARSGHTTVHHNGNLYIFGGKIANIQEKNEMWRFDIAKGTFNLVHDTLLEQTIDYDATSDNKKSRSKFSLNPIRILDEA
jgi:N-acetylneuraminic acid mutarotase